jgi:hypothetical protein
VRRFIAAFEAVKPANPARIRLVFVCAGQLSGTGPISRGATRHRTTAPWALLAFDRSLLGDVEYFQPVAEQADELARTKAAVRKAVQGRVVFDERAGTAKHTASRTRRARSNE